MRTMVKIEKKIKLDLDGVPKSDRKEAKRAVGDYLLNELRRYLKDGLSIVEGHGPFKKLNKQYAKDEKQGNTTPNLQDRGDYLHAHDFKINGDDSITYGIFKKKELDKADGHNQFSGKAESWAKKSEMPMRRTVPKGNERLDEKVRNGIKGIIDEYRVDEVDDTTTPASAIVALSELATDDVTPNREQDYIEQLFETEEELLARISL